MSAKTPKKQRALVIGFITLGIALTAFFGIRSFHAYKKFNGHRPPPPGTPGKIETDVELIRSWMTVSFISELYKVPDKVIFEALKIPPQENREKSLKDLNQEYYPDADGFVLDAVKAAVLANQPPPLPDSATQAVSPPTTPTSATP
jgi:uncharacterized protein involved in exopolysaccharide biosynthesis